MAYDHFMTPPDVIELARRAMGGIDFDPASNHVAQQYVKAQHYCVAPDDTDSIAQQYHNDIMRLDGLKQEWHGNVWLNPPYSNGNIDAFVDKAIEEWTSVRLLGSPYYTTDQMIILVNSSTDTKWFHKLCEHADLGLFWSGRIKFWKIFDGKAHEKWEGEVSKKRRIEDSSVKAKIGNAPRFLNTLFFFGRSREDLSTYRLIFDNKGTFFETL